MNREHRHELKTNELADWIAHAPQFFQQHGKFLAGVVFLVIAAVALTLAWRMKAQTAQAEKALACTAILQALQAETGLDAKIASLPAAPDQPAGAEALQAAAAKLESTAQTVSDPTLAVLATIKQADTLRAALHYRTVMVGRDEIVQAANKANELYRKALEQTADLPNGKELAAMARLGMALCAEELGQYDTATDIYEQIAEDTVLAGTVFPTRARIRLGALADFQGTYTFPDAPPEPEAASPAPGTPTAPVIDVEQIRSPASAQPTTPIPTTPTPAQPETPAKPPEQGAPTGDAEVEPGGSAGTTDSSDPQT